MLLRFGTCERREDLELDQKIRCPVCGKPAVLEAWCDYTCFQVLLFPVRKWNRRYYVRTSCCGATAPISQKRGEKIYYGEIDALNIQKIPFQPSVGFRICPKCGYDTAQEFRYCPMCGAKLQGVQPCLPQH